MGGSAKQGVDSPCRGQGNYQGNHSSFKVTINTAGFVHVVVGLAEELNTQV
jgi:hypothetical protein